MADACWMACSEVYENGGWVSTGSENIPTIFISVELINQNFKQWLGHLCQGFRKSYSRK